MKFRRALPKRLFCLLLSWVFCGALVFAQEKETVSWPRPSSLIEEIDVLAQYPETAQLSARLRELLEQLHAETPAGSPEAEQVLIRLASEVQSLRRLSKHIWQQPNRATELTELAGQLSRLGYHLERRLHVWQLLNVALQQQSPAEPATQHLLATNYRLAFDGIDPQWSEYLLMEDIQETFDTLNPSKKKQKRAARKTLARIYSPVLSAEQTEFLTQLIHPTALELLQKHAAEPWNAQRLLADLENYEAEPSSYLGYRINDQYQNLLWSSEPTAQQTATQLHTHYRNANFRLAISERLLNQMMPQLPTTDEPYTDQILGARVTGRNNISNQLHVKLIPDHQHLHLQLGTQGGIASNSVARRTGFVIRNRGYISFQAFQQLLIGPDGIDASQKPVAYASARQQVVGMQSKYDGLPILGWVARRVAQRKIHEQAPQTKQIVQNRVASTASERMQELVNSELQQMNQTLYQNLYQPLVALELEPEPIEMKTTQQQLVMRYRLAGRDQLAANTARPQDNPGDLLSLQIHQSAINNLIARLEFNGRTFTSEQLKEHIQEILGRQLSDAPDELEKEAKFQFAHFDPLRIDFRNGKVILAINLQSLKLGEGKSWKKVRISTTYTPQIEGTKIVLTQDAEGTRIKGHRLRLRDKAAISTVHKVLFNKEYHCDIMPADFQQRIGQMQVEISQLVAADGWAAIGLIETPTQQSQSQQKSTSRPFLKMGRNVADRLLR